MQVSPSAITAAAYVFDVEQTDGEPLPEPSEAAGDPGAKTASLKTAILGRGIALESADDLGGALGTSSGGCIRLLNGLSPCTPQLLCLALLRRVDDGMILVFCAQLSWVSSARPTFQSSQLSHKRRPSCRAAATKLDNSRVNGMRTALTVVALVSDSGGSRDFGRKDRDPKGLTS
jgi:hypothetical protein